MTNDESSNNTNEKHRIIFAWIPCLFALFPLMALVTYDARVYTEVPAAPSSNWIGALGDAFAHYGYAIFGLGIWIVPILCVIGGIAVMRGRRIRPTRRNACFALLIVSCSCLIQVFAAHGGILSDMAHRININSAGGMVGYLLMTRLLSPLLSNFGSSILLLIIAFIAIVGAIGAHNLIDCACKLYNWALVQHPRSKPAKDEFGNPIEEPSSFNPYEAVRQAREEAKRQREEEKLRAREEKQRAKEEARAAKEAEKLARAGVDRNPLSGGSQPKSGSVQANTEDNAPVDKGPYMLPSLSLLNPLKKSTADHGDIGETSRKLVDTLKLFGVNAELAYTVQGPVVTKYALTPEPGTRPEKFLALQNTLMMALKAKSLRIEAPIPGEDKIGIEVPNRAPAGISFREIIESDAWKKSKGELPLLFGKRADGTELVADLASMPHMLVAGATGQGKSVCLNAIINGLLMTKTPQELRLIMVDPKSVEFTAYAALPHLIVPVITDNKKVVFSLHWAVQEMEKRLKLFARAKVRNIYDFNHRASFTQTDMFGEDTAVGSDIPKTVPYIVIIIDEVADLMASNGKEVTPDIARLTAKARAAGIHLILATQRPDAKIITGTIKANIPGRVAFKTSQAIDSRTILDDSGAENLIGRGDMLFKGKDGLLVRAQGAWISDEEIARVTSFIEQHSNTAFDDRFAKKLSTIKEEEVDLFAEEGGEESSDEDDTSQREQVKAEENASDFKKAVECIINTNRASTSHFQRKLGWGYNHSAKIMDMLEDKGVIGPQIGAGPRKIIMDQNQLLAVFNGGDIDAAPTPAIEPQIDADTEDNLFNQETQT